MRHNIPFFFKAIQQLQLAHIVKDHYIFFKYKPNFKETKDTVHLHATNIDVHHQIMQKLEAWAGTHFTFKSIDKWANKYLQKSQSVRFLHLKTGCPVILIKYLNAHLVNGLRGNAVSVNMQEETVEVNFLNGRTAQIGKHTFHAYDPQSNSIVASRSQIPL